jgi:hypothetical protein
LKLEFNNSFNAIVSVDASRLVVKDNFGQPILVVLEYDSNTIAVYKAKPGENEEFQKALQRLGVKQTNDVREINI